MKAPIASDYQNLTHHFDSLKCSFNWPEEYSLKSIGQWNCLKWILFWVIGDIFGQKKLCAFERCSGQLKERLRVNVDVWKPIVFLTNHVILQIWLYRNTKIVFLTNCSCSYYEVPFYDLITCYVSITRCTFTQFHLVFDSCLILDFIKF